MGSAVAPAPTDEEWAQSRPAVADNAMTGTAPAGTAPAGTALAGTAAAGTVAAGTAAAVTAEEQKGPPMQSTPQDMQSMLKKTRRLLRPNEHMVAVESTATVSQIIEELERQGGPRLMDLLLPNPVVNFLGGSLLGVTTQMWAVKNGRGAEVALTSLKYEADEQKRRIESDDRTRRQRAEHAAGSMGATPEEDQYGVYLVHDSPVAIATAKLFGFGAFQSGDVARGVKTDVKVTYSGGELRYVRGDGGPLGPRRHSPLTWLKQASTDKVVEPAEGEYVITDRIDDFEGKFASSVGSTIGLALPQEPHKAVAAFHNPERAMPDPDEDGKRYDGTMRPSTYRQLLRVTDALHSIANVIEESHAVYVSDWPTVGEFAIDYTWDSEERFAEMERAFDKEPINILQKALRTKEGVTFVLPMEWRLLNRLDNFRNLCGPNNTLVFVVTDRFSMFISQRVSSALSKAPALPPSEVTHTSKIAPKRPAITVSASGGLGVLKQLANCAENGGSLVILDGSGRMSDLWVHVWPERTQGSFDPVVQQRRLSKASGQMANEESVSNLRTILEKGDMLLFSINNNSAALERLCRLQLAGDSLLDVAAQRERLYDRTRTFYQMPRATLLALSVTIACSSTTLALVVEEDDQSSILYYVVVVLPAVLVVVDSIDSFLRTNAAASAAARAAGLVRQQIFYYRTRAGQYADAIMAAKAKAANSDLVSMRQRRLVEQLGIIDATLATSGALPIEGRGTLRLAIADVASAWETAFENVITAGPGATKAGRLTGDEYIDARLNPSLRATSRSATGYLVIALGAHVLMYAAAATGTVLATLGLSKWVAMTVAFSTAMTRVIQTFRVDELRKANAKAMSALSAARLYWRALPREERGRQVEIDRLINSVEGTLEATLPPAEPDVAPPKKDDADDHAERAAAASPLGDAADHGGLET